MAKAKVQEFGMKLLRMFPGCTKKEAMQKLMDEHGSIRAINRATGIPLVSLSRWCGRLDVYNGEHRTRGWSYIRDIEAVEKTGVKGRTLKKKLLTLYEREGSWANVARLLEVGSLKHFHRFKRFAGIPNQREEDKSNKLGDSRWNSHEQYFGW